MYALIREKRIVDIGPIKIGVAIQKGRPMTIYIAITVEKTF